LFKIGHVRTEHNKVASVRLSGVSGGKKGKIKKEQNRRSKINQVFEMKEREREHTYPRGRTRKSAIAACRS